MVFKLKSLDKFNHQLSIIINNLKFKELETALKFVFNLGTVIVWVKINLRLINQVYLFYNKCFYPRTKVIGKCRK